MLCVIAIGFDLLLQRVRILETLLIPQSLDKSQPQLRSIKVFFEVEHVRFDHILLAALECGALADIGHRRINNPIERHGCGVNTPRRNEVVLRAEVCCRKSKSLTALPSLNDRAINRVVVAKQRTRFVHAPFTDEPPYARTADDELLVANWIDLFRSEPVTCAQAAQHGKIAG